jgi:excisionase family DNA binding protein
MNAHLIKADTVVPTEGETLLAQEASRILAPRLQEGELRVHLDDQVLTLPRAATRLLSYVLTEMAAGNAVTLIPVHAEMTTQEAADYLNVSRPFLVSLLEAAEIPYRKVGSRRRVQFRDVKAYKDKADCEREKVLDALAAQAQELGMGY